jgi:hydrogenase nickel incorporation protein HypA/HybF
VQTGFVGGVIHELSVTNAVLEIALDHAGRIPGQKITHIRAIKLKVGEMRDIVDEFMQQYFSYVSRGTLAEGARLDIERVPIVYECSVCTTQYPVTFKQLGNCKCPRCGENKAQLITGREFSIEGIEVAF